MKKLIVIILCIAGFAAGAFGGSWLRGADPAKAEADAEKAASAPDTTSKEPVKAAWFRMPTEFFIPILRNDNVQSVMILTLTVETAEENLSMVQASEHKLRDSLLSALMIHANTGGFDGNFTAEAHLAKLRTELLNAAQKATDGLATGILIENIARQEQ